MREVVLGVEHLGDDLMAGKLLAVVRSDGVDMSRQRPEQRQDGVFDALGFSARHLGNQCQA